MHVPLGKNNERLDWKSKYRRERWIWHTVILFYYGFAFSITYKAADL